MAMASDATGTKNETPRGGAGGTADLMVIFGISGDLARKMTFSALYRLERRKMLGCPIIGIAGADWSRQDLVDRARQAITEGGEDLDERVFDRFARRLTYLRGDVTGDALYEELGRMIDRDSRPLFYLEMPPFLFAPIVEHLAAADLLRNARVAVEKPFGHDLASARELNARLRKVLREDQILRVDHFLGKEPVIQLEYLRFANLAMADVWDRRSVSAIHITMAENFGVADRGSFYDAVGALRDVVQNHLLQVLALVAMEPPVGADADDLRDKKAELFRSIPPIDPKRCVRGQYQGYLDVPGVAGESATETFVALRLEIDNWRWSGVPVFLRAGKAMPETVTEVRLLLHRTPTLSFLHTSHQVERNQIVVRIDKKPGLRMQLAGHAGDTWHPVHLDTPFAEELGKPREPYERLLYAAMIGDPQLFAREDSVEETWRIVQPLLDHPTPVQPYEQGSWGPAAAHSLVAGHPPWQDPWLPPQEG